MECPKCKTAYTNDSKIPLLLIKCGHSVCQDCASNLFKLQSITCPECGKQSSVSSINQMPKNMALLTMSQTNNAKACESNVQNEEKQIEPQCSTHLKKVRSILQ
eukprot:TRINITY_DN12491_c0_g1_i1.p1 TRINITY_DN12491_c0_g1~~TRINITY_DN12491_c0_g1_i1.p1  ORF type:complete len:104 (+),score=12.31 TRINITY_DN12491_c0_g1_i1:49-360(+)